MKHLIIAAQFALALIPAVAGEYLENPIAVTITSEGDVKIVLEPRGKADVPTTPEFRNGL